MIRVLLVEDDPVIRDTTCYFLKSRQNFEVVCAETGGEALSDAREIFDVILMDILLPDTNGMDLCQRLRSWHHCPTSLPPALTTQILWYVRWNWAATIF